MEPHYNAFISYRHHPEDIQVATQIHRMLERFKVPKALKKQNKGITKLFRDKDELPLTSDLSESITAALENSEFLIVICSVHTKESQWVQREIEVFLKTHSRSQVLTVLVNGEPYEVIPQILLYEEVMDPATGTVTREPLEPLSCDWRMPLRKARREEFPRLAAALLHCSYDELRQRQKQYRMQQLLIGGSVALAFSMALAAYFLYTSLTIRNANLQIQEHYDQALKNQSKYLTTAAQEKLSKGDRFTALALLLEALPGEGNERPYLPEAELLLTDATAAYSNGQNLVALGAFIPDKSSLITEFEVTEDGQWIYILDDRGIVTVWKTNTCLQEAVIDPKMEMNGLRGVTAGGDILFSTFSETISRNFLQCYDRGGSLLWEAPDISECAFLGDKEILLAIRNDWPDHYLDFLDPRTGEQLRESIPLKDCEDGLQHHYFRQESYEEGVPLVLSHGTAESWLQSCCYVVDTENGRSNHLYHTKDVLLSACTLAGDRVVLMALDGSGGGKNGNYRNMITTSVACREVLCFDKNTGEQLWESEIVPYQYSSVECIMPIPQREEILCQSGNVFLLLDPETGEVLQHCESRTGVIKIVDVTRDKATYVLADGGLCIYNFDENVCRTMYYDVPMDMRQAEVNGGMFVLEPTDTKVTFHVLPEPEYTWEKTVESAEYAGDVHISGNLMVFSDSSAIYLYDLQNLQLLWKKDMGTFSRIDGFSPDQSQIWISDYGNQAAQLDVATGGMQMFALPDSADGDKMSKYGDFCLAEDALYYLAKTYQTCYLVQYTPRSAAAKCYPICEIPRQGTQTPAVLYVTGEYAWIYMEDGTLSVLAMADGAIRTVAEGLEFAPAAAVREDGTLAVSLGDQIWVGSPDGEESCRLSIGEAYAGSLYFRDQTLMVLTDLGNILAYDAEGTLLSHMEMSLVTSDFSEELRKSDKSLQDLSWAETPDGKLALTAFGTVNVFDCEEFAPCCAVECDFYHPDTDTFITTASSAFYGRKRYSLEALIQKAQKQLGDFQLSEEDREAYGIA